MGVRFRLLGGLVALMMMLPAAALAISNGNIGGRPANPNPANPRTQSIFIYQLKSGQQAQDGIKIFNNTSSRQTINLYAVDSVLSSGGAFACAQNSSPKYDVGAWIKLQSATVDLGPNSSSVVPFSVTVPASTSVGEHDGCIAIQAASQTATASAKSGVLLSFRSAIRVVVTVPGKITKKLTVQSVKVSRIQDGNYLVTPVIRNDGNVSLDTTLKISLSPVLGVGLVSVKEGSTPILPRTTASRSFEIKRPFWGGFFRAQAAATYNSNLAAGLGVSQDSQPQTVQGDSAVFFAAPKSTALIVEAIILIAILLIFFWVIRRLLQRQRVRTQWKDYTVKRGDSLQRIAEKHHVSWRKLAAANKIKPPYEIKPKQKLKVPAKGKE